MSILPSSLRGIAGTLLLIVLSSVPGGVCAALPEVENLMVSKTVQPPVTVTRWTWGEVEGATSYDLLASLSRTFNSGIVITREFLPSPQSTGTYLPDSGDILYYLVRARGESGFGTWGFHHDGTQRFYQCGDGSIAPGEECDDGNRAWADGCSGGCLVELEPLGPGGGGSPSGIITLGDDELVAAIDCGGIRRQAASDQIWGVEKIPPGMIPDPLDPAFGSEKINTLIAEDDYLFAGTEDGRLYRWHATSGWLLIWKDSTEPVRPIGTLYFDPQLEDVLYVGTGGIQMRRFRECQRHPDLLGTGQILIFPGAKSRAPVRLGIPTQEPERLLLAGLNPNYGGFDSCPPQVPDPPELPSITGLIIVESDDTPPEPLLYVATDLGVYTATWDAAGQKFFEPERPDTSAVWDLNSRRLAMASVGADRFIVLSVDCDLVIQDGEPVCGTPGQIYRQRIGESTWSMATIISSLADDTCVNSPSRGEQGCQRELWDVIADNNPDPSVEGEPSELYACDHGRRAGYLYKSVDAGETWTVYFETSLIYPDTQGGAFGDTFDCRHLTMRPENVFVAGHNNGGLWRISRSDSADSEYLTATSQIDDPDIVPGDPAYWRARGGSFPKTVNDLVFSPDTNYMYATVNDWAGIAKDPASPHWRWIRDREGNVGGGQGLDVVLSRLDPAIAVEAQSGVFESPEIWGTVDAGVSWNRVWDTLDYPFKAGETGVKRGVLELIVEEHVDGEYLYAAGNTEGDGGSNRWTVKRRRLDSMFDTFCSESGEPCEAHTECDGPERCIGLWEDLLPVKQSSFPAINSMDSASPTDPRIFLGTEDGLFSLMRGEPWEHYPNTGTQTWTIADVEAVSTDETFLALELDPDGPTGSDPSTKQLLRLNVETEVVSPVQVCDPCNSDEITAMISGLPVALAYRAAEGMLYAASRFSGIVSYDINNMNEPGIFLDQNSGLPTNWTTAIEFDPAGVAYVGTFCHGLWRFRESSATESIFDFSGTADGGFTIQLTVDSVMLEFATVVGQTAEQIAATVADAITDHPTLETIGTSAYTTSVSAIGTPNRMVTNGNVTSIVSNDVGISIVAVPPAP